MGKLLIAAATLAFAACQPMYGAPREKLRNPEPIKPPKVLVGADDPKKPEPLMDCDYRVAPVTKAPKRDIPKSQDYVRQADVTITQHDAATEPKSKGDLLIDSIQDYGAALQKDPYNAEATLKLARAYDKAMRKGCALKLLERLSKLSEAKPYERAATEQIDDVENHKTWFGDYRKEALRAVGR